MDVLFKLKELEEARGWSHYQTAKAAGLSLSTVSNTFTRNMQPTLDTLEKLCKGFGITLAQFFAGDDDILPEEAHELVNCYLLLNESDKHTILDLVKSLANKTK